MSREKGSTKTRILEAALDLFSDKGYDGIGVDLIAETVGMKGPSLYRHFKGKEDILYGLVEMFENFFEERYGQPEEKMVIPESLDELKEMCLERVNFDLQDSFSQKMRRLLTMEQFRNDEMRIQASMHQLAGMEEFYTEIFDEMIENGLLIEEDPRLLAFEFVSPIMMMIQLYDRAPEREEAVKIRIETHLEHFIKTYGVE